MSSVDFWDQLEALMASTPLRIDRPRGSRHPRYPEMVYPLDYGFLEATRGGDGAGLDLWLGSLPARRVTGVICTVDGFKRDAELKLLLSCTPDEMRQALAFHSHGQQAALLVVRPEESDTNHGREST